MFDAETAAPGLLPGVAWSEFEPSGLVADLLSSADVDGLGAEDALEASAAWERLVAHVLGADPMPSIAATAPRATIAASKLHPHPDGMAALWALLPADDATAAYARLDMLARGMDAADPRGMDARRADILTDLLLGRDVPGEAQATVDVQINLDIATLAGLADNPGHLAGYHLDIRPHPRPPSF